MRIATRESQEAKSPAPSHSPIKGFPARAYHSAILPQISPAGAVRHDALGLAPPGAAGELSRTAGLRRQALPFAARACAGQAAGAAPARLSFPRSSG